MNRDRAVPFVGTENEIGEFFVAMIGAVFVDLDRLDFSRDWIGDVHYILIRAGKRTLRVTQRQAGEARAAHLESLFTGEIRRVGLERAAPAGITGSCVKGHDGIPVVVGLL